MLSGASCYNLPVSTNRAYNQNPESAPRTLRDSDLPSIRRQWDPSLSTLLEEVIGRIVDHYRSGLTSPLSPALMEQMDPDIRALYHAGFHRVSRPKWAVELFPRGFPDLVSEINSRLEGEGIFVANGKGNVGLYGRLPASTLEVISVFQKLYSSGEINRDQAIEGLRDEFDIVLSESRQKYFFPQLNINSALTKTNDSGLSLRLENLAEKIAKIKEDSGVDLSIKQCVKGLVFEAFVGTYLSFRYGHENVTGQKQLPIAYHDLAGMPHRNVFLDFFVTDEESAKVFEVKLGNSFEGILNSSLAQLAALEEQTKMREQVTVVYLRSCPLMHFAVDMRIRVSEELNSMGLTGLAMSGRSLDEMIRYISIGDLIAEDPYAEEFQDDLERLQRFLEDADTALLKQYEDALRRIQCAASSSIPGLMRTLMEMADDRADLSPRESQSFFGKHKGRIDGGESAVEARIRTIQKTLRESRDTLIRQVYEHLFGDRPVSIDMNMVARLEAVDDTRFEQAVRAVLAERERRLLERLQGRNGETRGQISQVISAFDLVSKREQAASLDRAKELMANTLGSYQEIGVKLRKVRHRRDLIYQLGQRAPAAMVAMERIAQRGPRRFREVAGPQGWIGLMEDICSLEPASRHHLGKLSRAIGELAPVVGYMHEEGRKLASESIRAFKHDFNLEWDSLTSRIRNSPFLGALYEMRRTYKNRQEGKDIHLLVELIDQIVKPAGLFAQMFNCMSDSLERLVADFHGCSDDFRILHRMTKRAVEEPSADSLSEWGAVFDCSSRRLQYLYDSAGMVLRARRESNDLETALAVKLAPFEGFRFYNLSEGSSSIPDLTNSSQRVHDSIIEFMRLSKRDSRVVKPEDLMSITGELNGRSFYGALKYIEYRMNALGLGSKTRAKGGIAIPEEILMDTSAARINELDEAGLWAADLVSDFYMRKVVQARVLRYFSPTSASEFLVSNNPTSLNLRKSIEKNSAIVVDLSHRNDQIFSDLVLTSCGSADVEDFSDKSLTGEKVGSQGGVLRSIAEKARRLFIGRQN